MGVTGGPGPSLLLPALWVEGPSGRGQDDSLGRGEGATLPRGGIEHSWVSRWGPRSPHIPSTLREGDVGVMPALSSRERTVRVHHSSPGAWRGRPPWPRSGHNPRALPRGRPALPASSLGGDPLGGWEGLPPGLSLAPSWSPWGKMSGPCPPLLVLPPCPCKGSGTSARWIQSWSDGSELVGGEEATGQPGPAPPTAPCPWPLDPGRRCCGGRWRGPRWETERRWRESAESQQTGIQAPRST